MWRILYHFIHSLENHLQHKHVVCENIWMISLTWNNSHFVKKKKYLTRRFALEHRYRNSRIVLWSLVSVRAWTRMITPICFGSKRVEKVFCVRSFVWIFWWWLFLLRTASRFLYPTHSTEVITMTWRSPCRFFRLWCSYVMWCISIISHFSCFNYVIQISLLIFSSLTLFENTRLIHIYSL